MVFDPVTLAAPGILHSDQARTIWHSGVVLGPPGIVVVRIEIDMVEPRQWNPTGRASLLQPIPQPSGGVPAGDREQTLTLELDQLNAGQPIQAYIVAFGNGHNEIMMGENGFSSGDYAVTFYAKLPSTVRGRKGFPPLTAEQLTNATLHVDVVPLGMHFVVDLQPQ